MSLAEELLNSVASSDETEYELVPGENIFHVIEHIENADLQRLTVKGEECFTCIYPGQDFPRTAFEPNTQYVFTFEAACPALAGISENWYIDGATFEILYYYGDREMYTPEYVGVLTSPYDEFQIFEWVSPPGTTIDTITMLCVDAWDPDTGDNVNEAAIYIKTNMTIRPLIKVPVEPEEPEEPEEYSETIIINADRTVVVPEDLKRIAVQFDHNIETVTFECPRYWDGLDMSQMNVYINYIRSDNHTNSYPTEVISADEETMRFRWTISNDVTEVKGEIAFLVCVKKTDDTTVLVPGENIFDASTLVKQENWGLTRYNGEDVLSLASLAEVDLPFRFEPNTQYAFDFEVACPEMVSNNYFGYAQTGVLYVTFEDGDTAWVGLPIEPYDEFQAVKWVSPPNTSINRVCAITYDNAYMDEDGAGIDSIGLLFKTNMTIRPLVEVTEKGEEVNHWNSELCRDCYISEGLEAETVIAEQYPDIITQLLTGPISPEVSIEVIDGGHRVVVTDITGTKQFDVKDGKDGPKGEPGYINLDDDVVGEHAWSSKNIVDRLCPVLDETGSMVTCNPVAGYPLNVISHIVPYQAGSETPAFDNIRPISGYDEIILTHNDTQHNAELTQTVYGGSLDWSTGQFISDMEYMVLTGNETWGTLGGVGVYNYVYLTVGTYGYINTKIKATCSHCVATTISSGNRNFGIYATNSSGYYDARILFRLEGITDTVEAWTAFLKDQYAKGTPVSVAYGITAPTTTQFDPEEIIATTGINTLQSNTGDTTVTGRKDPIAVIEQLTTMLTTLMGGT